MNARRLIEILREDLAYFNWRVLGADAPSYPVIKVQDISCRGTGGIPQFFKSPKTGGLGG
jgi:hypothetical protein